MENSLTRDTYRYSGCSRTYIYTTIKYEETYGVKNKYKEGRT